MAIFSRPAKDFRPFSAFSRSKHSTSKGATEPERAPVLITDLDLTQFVDLTPAPAEPISTASVAPIPADNKPTVSGGNPPLTPTRQVSRNDSSPAFAGSTPLGLLGAPIKPAAKGRKVGTAHAGGTPLDLFGAYNFPDSPVRRSTYTARLSNSGSFHATPADQIYTATPEALPSSEGLKVAATVPPTPGSPVGKGNSNSLNRKTLLAFAEQVEEAGCSPRGVAIKGKPLASRIPVRSGCKGRSPPKFTQQYAGLGLPERPTGAMVNGTNKVKEINPLQDKADLANTAEVQAQPKVSAPEPFKKRARKTAPKVPVELEQEAVLAAEEIKRIKQSEDELCIGSIKLKAVVPRPLLLTQVAMARRQGSTISVISTESTPSLVSDGSTRSTRSTSSLRSRSSLSSSLSGRPSRSSIGYISSAPSPPSSPSSICASDGHASVSPASPASPCCSVSSVGDHYDDEFLPPGLFFKSDMFSPSGERSIRAPTKTLNGDAVPLVMAVECSHLVKSRRVYEQIGVAAFWRKDTRAGLESPVPRLPSATRSGCLDEQMLGAAPTIATEDSPTAKAYYKPYRFARRPMGTDNPFAAACIRGRNPFDTPDEYLALRAEEREAMRREKTLEVTGIAGPSIFQVKSHGARKGVVFGADVELGGAARALEQRPIRRSPAPTFAPLAGSPSPAAVHLACSPSPAARCARSPAPAAWFAPGLGATRPVPSPRPAGSPPALASASARRPQEAKRSVARFAIDDSPVNAPASPSPVSRSAPSKPAPSQAARQLPWTSPASATHGTVAPSPSAYLWESHCAVESTTSAHLVPGHRFGRKAAKLVRAVMRR